MVRRDVTDFLNEMVAVGMVELSASVMRAEAEGPRGRRNDSSARQAVKRGPLQGSIDVTR